MPASPSSKTHGNMRRATRHARTHAHRHDSCRPGTSLRCEHLVRSHDHDHDHDHHPATGDLQRRWKSGMRRRTKLRGISTTGAATSEPRPSLCLARHTPKPSLVTHTPCKSFLSAPDVPPAARRPQCALHSCPRDASLAANHASRRRLCSPPDLTWPGLPWPPALPYSPQYISVINTWPNNHTQG